MILTDCHVHTSFSTDSDTPVSQQLAAAQRAGLSLLCVTDHEDIGFPGGEFLLEPEAYASCLQEAALQQPPSVTLLTGIELGLVPEQRAAINRFSRRVPFDFIIGSTHLVDGMDPYDKAFWQAYLPPEKKAGTQPPGGALSGGEREAIRRYYEVTLENIRTFSCFDVYGHIDYIIRYASSKNRDYRYTDYQECLDEILRSLIAGGKGIECNTAGYRYGLGAPNPEAALLTRYRELGGEILTIGSDAHRPEEVGSHFSLLPDLLKSCGFRYYCYFQERTPHFLPL